LFLSAQSCKMEWTYKQYIPFLATSSNLNQEFKNGWVWSSCRHIYIRVWFFVCTYPGLYIYMLWARGRCYDHNFRRFFPIFGEKISVFLKYQQCYDQLFSKFSFAFSQKRQFFRKNFRRKKIKIITSVPGVKISKRGQNLKNPGRVLLYLSSREFYWTRMTASVFSCSSFNKWKGCRVTWWVCEKNRSKM
jgi:hypothetical protein